MSGPLAGLIEAWLDGELDAAGADRLRQALVDPAAAREFLLACHLEVALPAAARGSRLSDAAVAGQGSHAHSTSRRSPMRVAAWMAVAALLLIGLGGWWLLSGGGSSPRPLVGDGATARHHGADLRLDAIAGEPPRADLTADGVRLAAGRLSLRVERQGPRAPLIVATDAATMRVVGTRFTVEVRAGRTVLEVSEGIVRFMPAHGAERDVGAGARALAFVDPLPVPLLAWNGTTARDDALPGIGATPAMPLRRAPARRLGAIELDQDDDAQLALEPATAERIARAVGAAGGMSLRATARIDSGALPILLFELIAPDPRTSLLQLWYPEAAGAPRSRWADYVCTWGAAGMQRTYIDGALTTERPVPWVAPSGTMFVKLLWAASAHPAPRPSARVAYRGVSVYAGALDTATIRHLADEVSQ